MGEVVGTVALLTDDLPADQLVEPGDEAVLVADPALDGRPPAGRRARPSPPTTPGSEPVRESCASRDAMTAWTLAGSGRASRLRVRRRRLRPARIVSTTNSGLPSVWRWICRAWSGGSGTTGDLGRERRGLGGIQRTERDLGHLARVLQPVDERRQRMGSADLVRPHGPDHQQTRLAIRSERRGSAATRACRRRTTGGRRGPAGAGGSAAWKAPASAWKKGWRCQASIRADGRGRSGR